MSVRELLGVLLLQSFVDVEATIVGGGVFRQSMQALFAIVSYTSSLVRRQRYHLSGNAEAAVRVGLLEEWQFVIFVEGGDESVCRVPVARNEQGGLRVE